MSIASIDTTAAPPAPPVPSSSGIVAGLRRIRIGPLGLIGPAVAVVLVGAGGPLVVLVLYSLGILGNNEATGFGVYSEILTDGYYWEIYAKSLKMSATVTALSLIIGMPLAFIISKSRGWTRTLLMCAIVMPLMVNIVVRNLGWVIIITDSGVLNRILGVVGLEQHILGTVSGIALVLVHVGVPFIVLPMLTSIDRLDRAEVEAARALGAHPVVAFWRITLPRVATSAVAGSTLVFIIAMGSLVTPRFLGQGKVTIVPTLIVQQTLLIGMTMLFGTWYQRKSFPLAGRRTAGGYAGMLLAFACVAFLNCCYFFGFVFWFQDYPRGGNFGGMLVLLVLFSLAEAAFGMLLGMLFRTRERGTQLMIATSMPILFLAGLTWPVSSMPVVLQWLRWLLPSTAGIQGFVALNQMGASLYEIRHEVAGLLALLVLAKSPGSRATGVRGAGLVALAQAGRNGC